ncbi:hypothetical protein L7F22_034653 [Adiantum nelumboides]|nr:hypothetical protein [Adiantum nelumboides]
MENSNEHMMQQMMQQFAAFFQQQQVMQQRMNLEDRMRKARQCVIEKLYRFDGRDISKFCRAYEEAMEDNGIDDSVAIKNFHFIVKPELRGPIEELQGQHSVSWRNFKVALEAEYFLEDSQRVTKQTFIKWMQMKNKGLTSRELLREFEKKVDQLSTGEQQSLRSEKIELFVQAADSRLQKNLVQLLEDPAGELGLTNDWDVVPAAINLLVKHQKRIDKSIVVDSHEYFEENGIVEKIVEKPKASSSPTLEGKEKPKATQSSTLDDSTMDDLIKAFVEDKRKQEDEAPETSKRQTRANTRSDGERMQKSTPISEVQMEDASKDKKQSKVRGPSYKLRSDMELATNLKKVFEEHILNSKVEMTLGDILGIAKREFHEEIIDIIKRKRHVLVEQETNPTNSQNIFHEELEDLEEPRARMENDVAQNDGHYHELQSVLIDYRNGNHPSSEDIQSQVAGLWKNSPDLLQNFASFLPKIPVKFVSTAAPEKDEQDASIQRKRRNKKSIDCEEYDVLCLTTSYTRKRRKVQAEITVNELDNVKVEMTELEVDAQTHATVLSNACGDEMRLRESAPQSFKHLRRRSLPVFRLLTDKVDILNAVNKNSSKEISKIKAFLETAKQLHSDALISLQKLNMQVVQDTILLDGDMEARHMALEARTKKVIMTKEQPRMTKRQRERYAAKRQRSFMSMPISELDLSDCKQCSPSYRHLPRDVSVQIIKRGHLMRPVSACDDVVQWLQDIDYPLPIVCGRKKRDEKVLNDKVVTSVSNNNVNYNFKKHSINPYVKKLWKVDDDRYELDMVLERTSSTIKILKSILKRLSRKPEKEMVVEKHLTVNVIVKQQMRVDKLIMADSKESSDEEAKDKSPTLKHKLEDPVLDNLAKGYAYIAKFEAKEAWVEEKHKRDEEAAGTSKRATRSSNKKEEVLKPSPEVNMEDAPKDKKQDFLDNLEMAFLVSGRDDQATKLRAFPLVLREGAKAWYQTLAPKERRDWETLKTAFIEEFHHQEPPEEIWRQLLELRQTSQNDYKSYEGKFSNLWEKWCASLGEGERAPKCLNKDCFLVGLYPILQEKVKVKFPNTFEKAMAYAREKDRKLKFQAQLQGGMEPPPPAQPIARVVLGTSAPDQESSQQELLQQITNQLESLSINLVQGVRAPQTGNDRNRQEGQRQTREYVCYNCGEVGHGMYFCPHP